LCARVFRNRSQKDCHECPGTSPHLINIFLSMVPLSYFSTRPNVSAPAMQRWAPMHARADRASKRRAVRRPRCTAHAKRKPLVPPSRTTGLPSIPLRAALCLCLLQMHAAQAGNPFTKNHASNATAGAGAGTSLGRGREPGAAVSRSEVVLASSAICTGMRRCAALCRAHV
jgi:hypothetical protein